MITLKPGQRVKGEGSEELGFDDSGNIDFIDIRGLRAFGSQIWGVSPLLIKRLLVNFSSNIKRDTRLYLHRQARIKDIREFSSEYWGRTKHDILVGDFTFLVKVLAQMNVWIRSERPHSYVLWMEPREFILSVNTQRITLVDRNPEEDYFLFSDVKKTEIESPHTFRGFESDAVDWSDVNNFGVNSALKEYWKSLKDLPSR